MNFVLSPCNIFLLINADMASVHAVETFFEKWQGLSVFHSVLTMGNSEEEKSTKTEKPSSPVTMVRP